MIALFGDRIRSAWFRPKLNLELLSSTGDFTPLNISYVDAVGNTHPTSLDTRWYHLVIANKATGGWPPATDVRVYVTKLEEFQQGSFVTLWEETVPLKLRHEQAYQPRRTVGVSPLESDFLAVTDGMMADGTPVDSGAPRLSLQVTGVPNNRKVYFSGEQQLRITVVADSIETRSSQKTFEISWNGRWEKGESEMAKHLRVRPLPL